MGASALRVNQFLQLTIWSEVEQRGQLSAVVQLGGGVSQLVEEHVSAGVQRGHALRGGVLQQL